MRRSREVGDITLNDSESPPFIPADTLALRVYDELVGKIDVAGMCRRTYRLFSMRLQALFDLKFTQKRIKAKPIWSVFAPDSTWCDEGAYSPKKKITAELILERFFMLGQDAAGIIIINLSDFGTMAQFDSEANRFDENISMLSYFNAKKKSGRAELAFEDDSGDEKDEGTHSASAIYIVNDAPGCQEEYVGVVKKVQELFPRNEVKFIEGSELECPQQIFDAHKALFEA